MIFITFLTLAATGLPLHFSDLWWASYIMALFGGSDSARFIHRISAAVMILASIYHLFTIIAGTLQKIFKRQFHIKKTQIPYIKDLQDLVHDIKYFAGVERYRPKMEKFMYKQKLHYLAILWGSFVMITAGSTLLFPETMAKFWPNPTFFQDLARMMHADEAIMAMTVVVFWHWSNVHLVPGRFPLQWTFITGRITREHQIEEHFLEYMDNLKEIPQEREYMRNLLKEKRFEPLSIRESVEVKGGDL
jgi:cytochrome b subunit of formate dehydrogenase